MNVENYIDLRRIASSNAAHIYDACSEEQGKRIFILKQYTQPDISEVAIRNETEITQTIEMYASRSIVVPVFDNAQDADGRTYLVMQKKRAGVFLAQLLEGGCVALPYALACIKEVLRSLATLHSFAGSDERFGYLHLDLHPGNIFLENADPAHQVPGNAKFIDFATAVRIVNGSYAVRKITAVSLFSAPELYTPENTICTAAADLYSVGAIFYAMVVGETLPGLMTKSGSTKMYGEAQDENAYAIEYDEKCRHDTNAEYGTSEHSLHERAFLGPGIDTARRAAEIAGRCCEKNGVPNSVCRAVSTFLTCALDYNPVYRYRSAGDMLAAVERIENLLAACEKMEYETIFKTEYECFTDISDVHPETLRFSGNAFSRAVDSLDKRLHVGHIDVPFTRYLFSLYWQMAKLHWNEIPGRTFFTLVSSGIAVCNHTGDVTLGGEVIEALNQVKDRMDVMSYLDLNNKLVVQLADRYEFAQAADMQEKNVRALRAIRAGYEAAGSEFGMVSRDNVRSVFLARALSSLAVYKGIAFPDMPKDDIYALFDEAIDEFGEGGNTKITLCHKMHYAIMMNDRSAFEESCAKYFDADCGCLRISNLIDKCARIDGGDRKTLSDRFGLYALVKALYVFYLDDVKAAVNDGNSEEKGVLTLAGSEGDCEAAEESSGDNRINVLVERDILTRLRNIGDYKLPRRKAYDPYQTIFRYLALIEYAVTGKMEGRAEEYFDLSVRCVENAWIDSSKPLNIYMLIAYQTLAIYYKLLGEKERMEELTGMLHSHAEASGWKSLVQALDNGVPPDEVLVHEYA